MTETCKQRIGQTSGKRCGVTCKWGSGQASGIGRRCGVMMEEGGRGWYCEMIPPSPNLSPP